MSQKLNEDIRGRAAQLGSTSTGADWCIKALHPSDPLTEVRGIPDHSAVPSLLMNYQSTFQVSPNVGASGTWSFEASLLPHPIQFMYLNRKDSIHPNGDDFDFLNTQVDGVTHYDKVKSFHNLAQRYRLAYMSVTCYQDGPDLANQGTIVVSQPPVEPQVRNWCFTLGNGAMISQVKSLTFTAEDHPNFNSSQSMPNAYFGRSREGAYVPLKLTETCQDWRSEADACSICAVTNTDPNSSLVRLYEQGTPQFPFTGLLPTYCTTTPFFGGQATTALLNGTWAHISAQNLSVQTSFSFYIRCGIEMQVSPNSSLAPQLKLSPPYDPVALTTYFSVARELKDGYPSDYNDMGKIWGQISQALKAVAPIFGAIVPGSGPLIEGSAAIGDWVRSNRKKKKKRKARAPANAPNYPAPAPPRAARKNNNKRKSKNPQK